MECKINPDSTSRNASVRLCMHIYLPADGKHPVALETAEALCGSLLEYGYECFFQLPSCKRLHEAVREVLLFGRGMLEMKERGRKTVVAIWHVCIASSHW